MSGFVPPDPIGFMNIDKTDFRSMSVPELVRFFEVEGYVILPGILGRAQIDRIQSELRAAE